METASVTRSDRLASSLREQIVSGNFAPGDRLPTFQEIESTFSTSRGVVQIAIERLKKDGFINTESTQGLYVANHPPHLYRYGIVFASQYSDSGWSLFNDTLVREAQLLERGNTGLEISVFAGARDPRKGPEILERLQEDVLNDRLAGLILTPESALLAEQEPFKTPRLPKVFLFREPTKNIHPTVTGDGDAIIEKGLQHLAHLGCQRVAALRVEGTYSSLDASFFEKNGLEFRSQWVQTIGRGDTAVLNTLIPLLMDYPENKCPDGLFVMDDTLVNHAISAMVSMGLRIGDNIQMVAHCNWPSQTPPILPFRRIGFNVGQMLASCINAIDMQRQGKAPPNMQRIPAIFEEELSCD